MKIAILGFARDGQAAYDYWNHSGNKLTICDQNQSLKLPDGSQGHLGAGYLKNLNQFDLIVRTAGLSPKLIAEANPESLDILRKVTGNIDEFIRVSPSKNIIGVTGTKGKGTTSTLIAKMLEAGGYRVHLGGNIGISALELLKNNILPNDWIVLEQSSFQLIDQKHSPHIGICLMVEPEHLNWHADMEEYLTAKQQMFHYQTKNDIAIYYANNVNSRRIASVSHGTIIPYFAAPGAIVEKNDIKIDGQQICKTSDLKLLGKHNWQNVCAAITAVWQINQNIQAMRSVLMSFSGLEHRLELVREVDGVNYYDDSFGTTPETAIVAIEAFDAPKIIILGGSDKGSDFRNLARTIASHNVRQIILIGNTSHQTYKTAATDILKALKNQKLTNITSLVKPGTTTMKEIISRAKAAAKPGDVVLLSTACASFDLFKDYKDRGEQFKQSVLALV
jgi:UDP-N-acetylmuramoylalanine--D-glutamate ligase